MEGLALSPVNISYGLDLILQEDWKSDREFQEAVALLLDKVQDAHLVKIKKIQAYLNQTTNLYPIVLFTFLLPSIYFLATYSIKFTLKKQTFNRQRCLCEK